MTTPHKGLFIDMIAQHEGLAEELRDAPEPDSVFIVATGEIHEGEETYTRHDVRPPLCDAEVLYLHPPTVREPLTQARAEELAHRRCKRYIFIDDAPYQFDAMTLMDFVRDVQGGKP